LANQKSRRPIPDDHPSFFLLAGGKLKPAEALALEKTLKKLPLDLPCRLKLLGYYFRHSHTSKSVSKKRVRIVTWMIVQMPEHETLGQPWAMIDKEENVSGYDECRKLWKKQLAKHKDNVAIVNNAAHFLRSDPRIAETLYKLAIELEPKNPDRSRDLAWFLRKRYRKRNTKMREAFVAIRDAVRKNKKPERRFYLYDDVAELAFDVGEWSVARAAAQKCLSAAQEYKTNWNAGNAIHNGNCVLGRLALRKGNTTKAIFYLDEASKTHGSPQLNSFGPNMLFAQEMLDAGHEKAVIGYLEGCKRFWAGRSGVLSKCISQIKRGESPRLPRVIG
jgi:tetratricopeptide (TPR) repeat protein